MQMSFEQFCSGFGFRYFKPPELLFLGQSHSDECSHAHGLNADPPPELWWNIIPTVRFAERMRKQFGPLRVLSAYRTPAYNKAIGGSTQSEHMKFTALDLAPLNPVPVQEIYDWVISEKEQGRFSGGVGLYVKSGFVHIDSGKDREWID